MRPWPSPDVPELPGRGFPVRLRDTATGRLVDPLVDDGGDVPRVPPAEGADAGGDPAGEREARLYVCGITPYDATHLGHAATYVAFDLLVRTWRDAGRAVRYVQNVTDVDDPLLERAAATGVDWRALADEQVALFADDMAALRVLPPQEWVGAVESVPVIAAAVRDLVAAGAGYRVEGAGGEPDGDLYFDVSADPGFGAVSGLEPEAMLALAAERGGDPDRPGKHAPLDPLLWRLERPGEPAWDGGSLGRGRPGWHVECTAIAREHLGLPLDVQGGGSDLVFPHHEMGASHGHVLDGPPFARAYAHAGMVGLDGHKMSKSRGNLVLVSRLRADGVDPMAVRLAILAHHYRDDWSWDDEGLAAASARLERWRRAVAADGAEGGAGGGEGGRAEGRAVLTAVRTALADDLDAPTALRAVDAWVERDGGGGALVGLAVDVLLGVRL